MKRKKPSRKELLSSCSEIGPEDGADPRVFFRKRAEIKVHRKTLQLCSEVLKILSHALSWELGDDSLNVLFVESVVPAPDSTRLLVCLRAPAGTENPELLLEALRHSVGKLRAQIAAAIHRRRVPELGFRIEVGMGVAL